MKENRPRELSCEHRCPGCVGADHALTIIIPTFNEEDRLPWTLQNLQDFLDCWGIDYRVVVADDGSADATAQLSIGLGPRVSTVCLDRHRGKGAAMRNAVLRATGRVVAFTDADLPFELAALRRAFEWIDRGECEVVFGARDLKQPTNHASRRLVRQIVTWGFRAVTKRLVSSQVTDTQSGLKLFSLCAAREIFSHVTVEGFAFDTEVVFLAERLKLPLRPIAVNLIREYAWTASVMRDTLPMLRDVLKLRFRGRFHHGAIPPTEPLRELPRDADRKAA